jgi:hypothetical protein
MFYNQAWENASNFDLVIDIIEAARALSAKKSGPMQSQPIAPK